MSLLLFDEVGFTYTCPTDGVTRTVGHLSFVGQQLSKEHPAPPTKPYTKWREWLTEHQALMKNAGGFQIETYSTGGCDTCETTNARLVITCPCGDEHIGEW